MRLGELIPHLRLTREEAMSMASQLKQKGLVEYASGTEGGIAFMKVDGIDRAKELSRPFWSKPNFYGPALGVIFGTIIGPFISKLLDKILAAF